MGMIGNPADSKFGRANTDSFNGDGSTTVFTLTNDIDAATDIEVLVDNVQQSPFDGSYSVTAPRTLTFSEAPASGTNNVYVMYGVGYTELTAEATPKDDSVTTSKIADGAVHTAKIADGAITHSKTTFITSDRIKLPTGTSDPSSPTEGDAYWDTAADSIKVYTSTNWKEIGGAIGSLGNPATSATEIKNAGKPDGVYYYNIGGETFQSYTITRYDEAAYIKVVQWYNGFNADQSGAVNLESGWVQEQHPTTYNGKLSDAVINQIESQGPEHVLFQVGLYTGDNLFNNRVGTGRISMIGGWGAHTWRDGNYEISYTHQKWLDMTSDGTWDYGASYTNDTRSLCAHSSGTRVFWADHNYNGNYITTAAPVSSLATCFSCKSTHFGTNLHWMSGLSTQSGGDLLWGFDSSSSACMYMEF